MSARTDVKTQRRALDYNVGATAVVLISIAVAAILYALPLIPFNFYSLFAWIFGPWGVFTIVYSFVAGKDSTYYLVWGTVMVAIGVIAASYDLMPIIIVLAILIIVLAAIGVIAYWRSRK
jgi:hypothetical protein